MAIEGGFSLIRDVQALDVFIRELQVSLYLSLLLHTLFISLR